MQIKNFQPFMFGMTVHCSLKYCEDKDHFSALNSSFDYLLINNTCLLHRLNWFNLQQHVAYTRTELNNMAKATRENYDVTKTNNRNCNHRNERHTLS